MGGKTRVASIDQFRGFAVLAMVAANFLAGIKTVPAWLKHADDIGLTIIDLIAPFFIFAIGLTYGLSARRRAELNGWPETYKYIVTRYMAIIGIGMLLGTGQWMFGLSTGRVPWSVLPALGVAGALSLLVIRRSAWFRLVVAGILLGIYQFMLNLYWLDEVLHTEHGGVLGALSWTSMLMASTALGDFFHDRKSEWGLPVAAVISAAAGLALSLLVPLSKHRVSASYVLVTLGVACFVFWLFHLVCDRLRFDFPLLGSWGMNPLLLFILHNVCLAPFVVPDIPWLYRDASLWLVAVELTIVLGVLQTIAAFLRRRHIVFSI